MFGDALSAGAAGEVPPDRVVQERVVEELRRLQSLARSLTRRQALPPGVVPGLVPLGRPGAGFVLREALAPGSMSRAVVFITCAALVLATGGHPVEAPGSYVLARGVDTAVGCLVALLVYRTMPSRPAATLPAELAGILRGVSAVAPHLARGEVATPAARALRRDLQHASFELEGAYASAIEASPAERREAERRWPAVAAAQQLAYRTLSACWTLEPLDAGAAAVRADALMAGASVPQLQAALAGLATAVAAGQAPSEPGPLARLLERELRNLHECLAREAAPPAAG